MLLKALRLMGILQPGVNAWFPPTPNGVVGESGIAGFGHAAVTTANYS